MAVKVLAILSLNCFSYPGNMDCQPDKNKLKVPKNTLVNCSYGKSVAQYKPKDCLTNSTLILTIHFLKTAEAKLICLYKD